MNYTDRIKLAVENANNKKSKLIDTCLQLEGCSSPKIRHLLNNLVFDGDRYLEVGCYKGSTSVASLYGNNIENYFLIDNYSEFPPELGSEKTKNEFLDNFTKLMGYPPKNFYNVDCFSVDKSIIKNINVYLYDGHHSYDAQKKGITYFYDCLEPEFILCVDDWDTNGWGVKEGTYDAIKELNLKTEYLVELPHGNVNDSKLAHTDDLWWFGFAVFHLKKY